MARKPVLERQSPMVIEFPGEGALSLLRDAAWPERPLQPRYAMVFFDGLTIKVRDGEAAIRKHMHLALGILPDGSKDVLAAWFDTEEHGARRALRNLARRGVDDIVLAVVDGAAIAGPLVLEVFAHAAVQTSIKLVTERSLERVPTTDRQAVAQGVAGIAAAPDAQTARHSLDAFEARWRDRCPFVAASWRSAWDGIVPFFDLPRAVRDIVSTTTAVESTTAKLRRRASRLRRHYRSEDAAVRHLAEVLRDAAPAWRVGPAKWTAAQAQLSQLFGDRFAR
jgi:putative transposase